MQDAFQSEGVSTSIEGLEVVFSDNLIPFVNTHHIDACFHGINEAASYADACEKKPPSKLLFFIATSPHPKSY